MTHYPEPSNSQQIQFWRLIAHCVFNQKPTLRYAGTNPYFGRGTMVAYRHSNATVLTPHNQPILNNSYVIEVPVEAAEIVQFAKKDSPQGILQQCMGGLGFPEIRVVGEYDTERYNLKNPAALWIEIPQHSYADLAKSLLRRLASPEVGPKICKPDNGVSYVESLRDSNSRINHFITHIIQYSGLSNPEIFQEIAQAESSEQHDFANALQAVQKNLMAKGVLPSFAEIERQKKEARSQDAGRMA